MIRQTLKRGDVLKLEDLSTDTTLLEYFDMASNSLPLYILKIKGKKYLVKREGECLPKKCKSACCKILGVRCNITFSDGEKCSNYFEGFADRTIGDTIILPRKCKYLCKDNTCKKWGTDYFPGPCQEFPHPIDGVYLAVISQCTFRFKIKEVIQ